MFLFRVLDFGDAEHVAWHERVPGAKRFGRTVSAGANCAWLVKQILEESHAQFECYNKSTKTKVTWPKTLRDVVRGKPIKQWLMKHQQDANRFALPRSGSLLLHPPGAGKSASAIVWSAFDDTGRTLWITRAISKISHSQQIEEITTCKTQILWNQGPTALMVKVYESDRRLAKKKSVSLDGKIGVTNDQGWYIQKSITPGPHTFAVGGKVFKFMLQSGHDACIRINLEESDDRIDFRQEPYLDPEAQFLIINWEILPFWYEALIAHGFTSVVFDEIQKAKNPVRFLAAYHAKTDNTKFIPRQNIAYASMRISRKAKRRLGLTATPIKDRTRDLWAQMDLLEPDQWGSRKQFMMRYANRHVNDFGGIDDRGHSNIDELKKRFMMSTHRVSIKETHANLPPLRRETIIIPSSEQSTREDRAAAKELAGKGPVEAAIAIAASRKRESVFELIEEPIINDQHVTVFTNRRADAEDLHSRITKRFGGSCPVILIHGGIPAGEKRENLRTAYMRAKGAAVLIATGDSMGEAIDLNKTDLAIMAQLPYTWAQLDQWEKRFYRLGLDRPVRIVYPIAQGTIDERIMSVLLGKLPPVAAINQTADLDEMRRALLGGKTDEQIQQDLVDFILADRSSA